MQEYSVGFMFDDRMERVLLIQKQSGPACVLNKWNGLGGHIEPGKVHVSEQDDVFGGPNCNCGCQEAETPKECMVREFHEECGVVTDPGEWLKFTELRVSDAVVHCYWASNSQAIRDAHKTTREEILDFSTRSEEWWRICPNVAPHVDWWVPFLCDQKSKNHLCVVLGTH